MKDKKSNLEETCRSRDNGEEMPCRRRFQLGFANGVRDLEGLQMGSYNYAEDMNGYQIGIMSDTYNGKGAQINCLISRVRESFKGLQVALVPGVHNPDGGEARFDGLQIGLVNLGPRNGNYFQIGLINYHDSDKWFFKYSPFIGFHIDKKMMKKGSY